MKDDSIHTWDDIVFENRNKEYGAYHIRGAYSRHIVASVIAALIAAALVLSYPLIAELLSSAPDNMEVETKTIRYTDLAPPPPIDKDTPPPPRVDVPPPVKTVIKFLPPKVTDKEVDEEEEMPTVEEVKQNDVGAENIEGTGDIIFDEPVQEVLKEEEDEDRVFTVVEQQAEFDGGLKEMYKFVSKYLKYPSVPRRMGIEGSVFISFIVDKDGTISQVEVVKGIHADCDREAVRVIKMMPNWKPGKQNGKAVKSRFVLPIKFRLDT